MFLLDENLSASLVQGLEPFYPGITHVEEHGLVQADDALIWDFARQKNAVLITCDRDFLVLSEMNGAPPKVLHIKPGGWPTGRILENLVALAPAVLSWRDSPDMRPMVLSDDGTLKPYRPGPPGKARKGQILPPPPAPGG